MTDQRTNYSDVELIRSTSAKNVIFVLEHFFSLYGIPNKIISGNDPPFPSCEVQEYFAAKGIKPNIINPLWS